MIITSCLVTNYSKRQHSPFAQAQVVNTGLFVALLGSLYFILLCCQVIFCIVYLKYNFIIFKRAFMSLKVFACNLLTKNAF